MKINQDAMERQMATSFVSRYEADCKEDEEIDRREAAAASKVAAPEADNRELAQQIAVQSERIARLERLLKRFIELERRRDASRNAAVQEMLDKALQNPLPMRPVLGNQGTPSSFISRSAFK